MSRPYAWAEDRESAAGGEGGACRGASEACAIGAPGTDRTRCVDAISAAPARGAAAGAGVATAGPVHGHATAHTHWRVVGPGPHRLGGRRESDAGLELADEIGRR